MNRRWRIIGSLLALTILGTAALCVWGKQLAEKLNTEVFKLVAQLILLVGFGGVASLVLEELNRAREQRDAMRAQLRETLADILRSYNEVKRLRRLLRAQAVRPTAKDPNAIVYRDEYGALLKSLNDAQLQLETHARLIEGNPDQYPNSEILIRNVRTAEKYLGNIITEWEEHLACFSGTPPQKRLADLPALKCFLGKAQICFGPTVGDPISAALVALSYSITKLT